MNNAIWSKFELLTSVSLSLLSVVQLRFSVYIKLLCIIIVSIDLLTSAILSKLKCTSCLPTFVGYSDWCIMSSYVHYPTSFVYEYAYNFHRRSYECLSASGCKAPRPPVFGVYIPQTPPGLSPMIPLANFRSQTPEPISQSKSPPTYLTKAQLEYSGYVHAL